MKQSTKKRLVALSTWAFFSIGIYAAFQKARTIHWGDVGRSLVDFDLTTLSLALMCTVISYALYGTFDVLSKIQIGHRVSAAKSALAAFLSFAFNLNLGSIIGGIAFRFRIYSRFGLEGKITARIIGFSILSNWSGYVLLSGLILTFAPPRLPPDWGFPIGILHSIGAVMLTCALAYLFACQFFRRREIKLFNKPFDLPTGRMALAQLVLSSLSWLAIASVIYVLFKQRIPFSEVLAIFLISGFAGVITHVPAGLGVTEAVFLEILEHQLPEHEIMATVLVFRAVYY
ncbi:MAG TPA: lysylphosphatidylglycerol synthase domain-containing protein, partial [Bdellovibrionales bacterium]|nr:lysylphosphatidylglycerol synthase domain-containing protein [Bdellovibrionales bacterium]